MSQLFLYCSNDHGVWVDRRIAPASDLRDALDQAARVVQSLVMTPSAEDWRGWTVHASDDCGVEVFAMPFATVLGKAH